MGNCYVTGAYTDGASFSGVVLSALGPQDIYVAKYDGSGDLLWIRTGNGVNPTGNGNHTGMGVDTDSLGASYVTGVFGGTTSFDTTVVTGNADVFTAKYDAAGNVQWVKQGVGWSTGHSIATSPGGDSYIVGEFLGSVSFDDTTLVGLPGNPVHTQGFVVKYNAAGDLQLALHLKATTASTFLLSRGIALTPAGGFVVTGLFDGSVAIGDSLLTSTSADMFVASFDAAGTFEWATVYQLFLDAAVLDRMQVATDAAGNIYATTGERDFADAALLTLKFSPSGQLLWENKVSDPLTEIYANDIVVTPDGVSYVTGEFYGFPPFCDTTLVYQGRDMFIVSYDTDGNCLDLLHVGGAIGGGQRGRAMDLGSDGSVFVAGDAYTVLPMGWLNVWLGPEENFFLAKLSGTPSAASDPARALAQVELHQNYPNPFNPVTTIGYTLASEIDVRVDVFDPAGRHVRSLLDKRMPAGSHTIDWDGTTDAGMEAATGVYFYRIRAGLFTSTRKMVLVK